MEFLIFLSYVVFAFLLFLFLNFANKKYSLTKFQYVIFTNVFLLFLAGVASYFHFVTFCHDIFIIVIFEFLIRMLYTTYLLEKNFFSKEDGMLSLYLVEVVVTYVINQFIIRQVDMVFLNPEQLKFLLWVFVILFFFYFFQEKDIISFQKENKGSIKKTQIIGERRQYIISQYAKMKQKYGKYISIKGDLRFLIYAIMIYENYRRPTFFRQLDYFRYQFDHVPRKQGIMQVDTKRLLNDIESIELVEKKLEKLQENKKTKKNVVDVLDLLKGLGKKKDDLIQIEHIYCSLKEFAEL